MSSTTAALWCRACGLVLEAGQALRVTPTSGNPPPVPFAIHRPSVVSGCLARAAARTVDATIALLDPEAARLFDLADGGPRANGAATFVARALARNAEISAAKPRYEEE